MGVMLEGVEHAGNVSSGRVCRFAVGAIIVGVSLATPKLAIAEQGCTLCATRSRADGRAGADTIPRSGTGSVTLLGVAGSSAREPVGLGMLSLLFGLPMYSAIHVGLPVLHADDTISAGSPSASLLAYLGQELPRGNVLKIVASVGATFPAIDAPALDVGLHRASAEGFEFRSRTGASLIHPSRFSFSLHHEREGARQEMGATMGFVTQATDWSMHAGLVAAVDSGASFWSEAAIGYRPRWAPRWALTLFGGVDVQDVDSAVAGLALSYSYPIIRSATDPGEHLIGTSGKASIVTPKIEDGRYLLARVAVPDKVTLVAFKASWCTACRHLDVDLRRLASNRPDVVVVFLDADDLEDLFAFNGGTGLPLVIVLDASGNEIGRSTGNMNAVEQMVEHAGRAAASEEAHEQAAITHVRSRPHLARKRASMSTHAPPASDTRSAPRRRPLAPACLVTAPG